MIALDAKRDFDDPNEDEPEDEPEDTPEDTPEEDEPESDFAKSLEGGIGFESSESVVIETR